MVEGVASKSESKEHLEEIDLSRGTSEEHDPFEEERKEAGRGSITEGTDIVSSGEEFVR